MAQDTLTRALESAASFCDIVREHALHSGDTTAFTYGDEVITERMSRRNLDRFEAAGPDFHQRVIDGFREMAAADPDRWVTVGAVGSIDQVAAAIRTALADRIAL